MIRLQKYLANAGVCSRRAAEALILSGRVSIDGEIVTELGSKVDPYKNVIRVDKTRIVWEKSPIYLLLNKPKGVLTTVRDPYGRATIMDLLGKVPGRVYPVGRLDKDSEGLLLLTNDGALAHRLLHPSHKVKKTYHATIRGRPAGAVLDLLRQGVDIEGKMTLPCEMRVLKTTKRSTVLEIVLKEGRKRQIRLMLNKVNHPVIRLIRIKMGPVSLGKLQPGKYRILTSSEVESLKKAVGLI
ncbi:MAG: rRNA pseudouridine synthase [Deltaproteobacteria bacterium]|nr:rRNA pseudouridine synthase [Deltaproteobacteria bacterium]MBW1964330.1 rRNA pseudouridine synthase [Deltaproteobacteria bacterium]MBW2080155.1 rRNA pseudouridine synthase [Deltaproteobacteria bacterium]